MPWEIIHTSNGQFLEVTSGHAEHCINEAREQYSSGIRTKMSTDSQHVQVMHFSDVLQDRVNARLLQGTE